MKKIMTLMVFTITITSCSIQKRHYLKGFYIGVKDKKQKSGFVCVKQEKPKRETYYSEIKNRYMLQLKAETDPEPVLTASKKTISISPKIKQLSKILPKPIEKILTKNKIKRSEREKNYVGISILKALFIIIGIIIMILGIDIYLLSSIAGGIIFFAVGLMFLIIGAVIKKPKKEIDPKPTIINNIQVENIPVQQNETVSKPLENTIVKPVEIVTKEPDQKQSEPKEIKQDVIYLKNGSIIRGEIVENVINVSLKIETKDGNVFVYKMAEILKITKEKAR